MYLSPFLSRSFSLFSRQPRHVSCFPIHSRSVIKSCFAIVNPRVVVNDKMGIHVDPLIFSIYLVKSTIKFARRQVARSRLARIAIGRENKSPALFLRGAYKVIVRSLSRGRRTEAIRRCARTYYDRRRGIEDRENVRHVRVSPAAMLHE